MSKSLYETCHPAVSMRRILDRIAEGADTELDRNRLAFLEKNGWKPLEETTNVG